jgi:putative transposase
MRFRPRRSSPRLSSFDYVGGYAYHIVLTTRGHRAQLSEGERVSSCLARLQESSEKYAFRVLAYSFMPDHLHLLLAGADRADLIRFVQHFKQATGYHHPGLWQRSYYDRVLRREDDIDAVARYIWSNPLVAGLVEDARHYPHSGPRDVLEAETGLRARNAEDRAEALSLRGLSR